MALHPLYPDQIWIWRIWICFWGDGKTGVPGEKLLDKVWEPTTNSTHICHWDRFRELNWGHNGGRWLLSPLRHPCSPKKQGWQSRDATFLCSRWLLQSLNVFCFLLDYCWHKRGVAIVESVTHLFWHFKLLQQCNKLLFKIFLVLDEQKKIIKCSLDSAIRK